MWRCVQWFHTNGKPIVLLELATSFQGIYETSVVMWHLTFTNFFLQDYLFQKSCFSNAEKIIISQKYAFQR